MLKKVIIYILLFYTGNFFSQECFKIQYDTSLLNKDLSFLKNILLKIHPSIGFYESKEFYQNYFDTALLVKNPLTEKEFRRFIKSKLSYLHCGHTNILPSKRYSRCLDKKKNIKLIPYFITLDNNHLIVVKPFSKQDSILKTYDTILKIDGKNADEYIHLLEQLLFVDGNAINAKKEMIQRHFSFYLSGLMEKDSFQFVVKNSSGIREKVIYTREYTRVKNDLMSMKSDTLWNNSKKYYKGLYLDKNKNIYYMKIITFGGIRMKSRFRKAFREMKKNKTEYLIIDLRNNPGGKITQSLNLLSYLLQQKDSLLYQKVIFEIPEKKYVRKKLEYRIIDFFLRWRSKKISGDNIYSEKINIKKRNRFYGKIYVLVNANTFSAANLVSVYLSKQSNVTIVGTEPSAVIWGSNAVSFLKIYLPKTKIKIFVPTYRIYHTFKNEYKQNLLNPLKPNIPVQYNTSDLLNKKDKELEAVYFDLIKK